MRTSENPKQERRVAPRETDHPSGLRPWKRPTLGTFDMRDTASGSFTPATENASSSS